MDTASVLLLAVQTALLVVSTFFTWRTIVDAGRERERERQDARRRADEAHLDAVAQRALEVYEAAEAWRARRPQGRLFEPAQKHLAYALAVAPALPSVHALANMVGEPAASITGEVITEALDEVEDAHREHRHG